MPGTGSGIPGLGQAQRGIGGSGNLGAGVSGSPPTILIPKIVIGNKHLQHTSVIGFTNLPEQPITAYAGKLKFQININNIMRLYLVTERLRVFIF
jgi:hypothetical protein